MPEGVSKDGKNGKEEKKKESPKKRSGNLARVKVEMLDGSVTELEVDVSSKKKNLIASLSGSLIWHSIRAASRCPEVSIFGSRGNKKTQMTRIKVAYKII